MANGDSADNGTSTDFSSSDQPSGVASDSYSSGDVNVYSGNVGNETNANNPDYTGQTGSDVGQGSYGADIAVGDLPHSDPYNPNYFGTSSYLVPSDLGYGPGFHYDPVAQATYQSYVDAASAAYGGDIPDFEKVFTSLIRNAESGFNPTADSGVAYGIAQINYKYTNPKTGQSIPDQLGINVYDPIENIYGGANLLAQYYHQFGNWNAALRAYNSGSPTGSNDAYVSKILDNAETATIFYPGLAFSVAPASTPPSAPASAPPSAPAHTLFGIPVPKVFQPKTPGTPSPTPDSGGGVLATIAKGILAPVVAPITPSEQANAGGSVIGNQSTNDPTPSGNLIPVDFKGPSYLNPKNYGPKASPFIGMPNAPPSQLGQTVTQDTGSIAQAIEDLVKTIQQAFAWLQNNLTIENVFASLLIVFLLFMSTRALLT